MIDLWAIDDAGLDVYQFRLLCHIARVGICYKSVRTLAEDCGMSLGKVSQVQNWLKENGHITQAVDPKTGRLGLSIAKKYERSYDEQTQQLERSYDEQNVHDMNKDNKKRSPHEQNVHHMNKKRSPHERKTITNKTITLSNKEREGTPSPNPFWDIPENLKNQEFIAAWGEWLGYVDERKLDFVASQAKLTLDDLARVGPDKSIEYIKKSIRSGWKNIYLNGDGKKQDETAVSHTRKLSNSEAAAVEYARMKQEIINAKFSDTTE